MGILEKIDALNLSDEEKAELRQEYTQEVDPLKQSADQLRAQQKATTVKADVTELSELIGEQYVGALKLYRQVLLSDDEEPGLVLLSDSDLGLSGDDAIGASGKREVTTAGVLKEFVGLLKQGAGTAGRINLSDEVPAATGDGHPGTGTEETDPAAKTKQHKESLAKSTGLPPVTRTRKRYRGGVVAQTGGDA